METAPLVLQKLAGARLEVVYSSNKDLSEALCVIVKLERPNKPSCAVKIQSDLQVLEAYNEYQTAETMRPGLQCPGLITSQNFFGFQGFTVLSSRHGGQTLQELNLSMPDDLRRQQTPWIGANLFASMAAVHNKGLLFKDIKPTNITWDTAKNIITHIDMATADKFGSRILGGTYGFMPPEAFQKVQHNGQWLYAKDQPGLHALSPFHRPSWDVFSAGVVLARWHLKASPKKLSNPMDFEAISSFSASADLDPFLATYVKDEAARAFFRGILDPNPDTRWSVKKALRSKFLRPSFDQVLAHWDKVAEQVAAEDAAAQEAGQLLHELFSQGITLCDLPLVDARPNVLACDRVDFTTCRPYLLNGCRTASEQESFVQPGTPTISSTEGSPLSSLSQDVDSSGSDQLVQQHLPQHQAQLQEPQYQLQHQTELQQPQQYEAEQPLGAQPSALSCTLQGQEATQLQQQHTQAAAAALMLTATNCSSKTVAQQAGASANAAGPNPAPAAATFTAAPAGSRPQHWHLGALGCTLRAQERLQQQQMELQQLVLQQKQDKIEQQQQYLLQQLQQDKTAAAVQDSSMRRHRSPKAFRWIQKAAGRAKRCVSMLSRKLVSPFGRF